MLPVHIIVFYLCLTFDTVMGLRNSVAIQLLKDPETIVSENGNFKLGFFSPSNATNRYLGIWYNNVSPPYYVWVANRNKPLVDSSGVFRLSEDGNLQVLNARNRSLWSLNFTRPASNATRSVQLLDTGNLRLLEFDTAENTTTKGVNIVWQSFDHPTDSLLPITKLTMNSSKMMRLYSWKSPCDPSEGKYTMGVDSATHPQMVIWDGEKRHYRSGPWNGNVFLGMLYTDPTADYADTSIQKSDTEGAFSLVYTGANNLTFSHYSFSYNGSLNEVSWDPVQRSWQLLYRSPDVDCDFYGKCGAFGICNRQKSPICQCLRGFRPKNPDEWSRGNWTSGCIRKTPLQCGTEEGKQDGFLSLPAVKLPDLEEWLVVLDQNDCRSTCLGNCSCLAYAYDAGVGCMQWNNSLIDIQQFSSGGINLFLRLAQSELRNRKRRRKVTIIAVTLIFGAGSIAILLILLRMWLNKRKEKETRRKNILESFKYPDNNGHTKLEELPLFDFEILAAATNNFSITQKLGQGGFGQVYRGRLEDGQEIAVKRLSTASKQGMEEFRNEVVVISRLQHKNLVKLLGFCVHGEEKLLVYEYMPNKSLSPFLFDPIKRELLDWNKRFNIIEGICRGLIYLHRDSRLKIIHRDLKAGNILLDEQLNPKISDFGMARIFGHGQDQDETRRVVGTYGYMSPEYAMEGHFSEKSDVFSFGVLLLEILTGKRNGIFWFEEEPLTLLGYMWKMWVDGRILTTIDRIISDPLYYQEIQKCVQVGLLCVQENVNDRPSMSTVMLMLASDITELPGPKQPGFNKRQVLVDTITSQDHSSSGANNGVSITTFTAR